MLARSLEVQLTPLLAPNRMNSLDGSFLWVTYKTCLIQMTFGDTRLEEISFYNLHLSSPTRCPGPALAPMPHPSVNWVTEELHFNSDYCRASKPTPPPWRGRHQGTLNIILLTS